MVHPERPENYQSNPERYLVDYPNAIPDKDRAHELAVMTDYWETRAANLRLGLKAIMNTSITRDSDGSRYIVLLSEPQSYVDVSFDMHEALMEDATYSNDYPDGTEGIVATGGEVISVGAALQAIANANANSQSMYDEGYTLLGELDATKR